MDKNKRLVIVCLPVAGEADPGQLLMIQGLNSRPEIKAFSGINDRFFGIIRSAITYNPDFIHFDWIESYYIRRNILLTYLNLPLFYLQLFICKYILRIKFAWTIHNILPHDRSNIRLKYFVLRSFSLFVKYIRVLSMESVNTFSTMFKVKKNKIHFVGVGDFTNYYPDSITKSSARDILNIPSNVKVLLTLGSVKQYKGIPEYLKIIKNVRIPDIYILIAGKCSDEKLKFEINSFTDERIHFINEFIGADELQNYYNAADLVVLPFLEIENSGSVVMAMGFKKPIIAPRSNVLKERLKYQSEFLYEKDGLQDVIVKAINTSEAQLKVIGEKNFLQLKEYSWTDFANFFYTYEIERKGKL